MKTLMILVFVLLMAGWMQAPQTDLEGLKAMIDVSQSAFDARDPAAIAATSAVDDRQYVVIAAGGHAFFQTTPGDYVIAFSLNADTLP